MHKSKMTEQQSSKQRRNLFTSCREGYKVGLASR